jgi:hypothetical protein
MDKKKRNGYELFRDYRVEANSLEDFLATYYKKNSLLRKGQLYNQHLLASYRKNLKENGYCFIIPKDSVTGKMVSYYDAEE